VDFAPRVINERRAGVYTGDAGFLDRDKRLAHAFTLVRATGVFVNVDRVKDGELQTNSRRTGVEPGDPQTVVPAGVQLTQIDAEEVRPEVVKTQDLAKQLIR
jgi:hypothetical protein